MIVDKPILTAQEAAELMGCSVSTIEEHARNRVLPGLRLGRDWRFPREAFLRAINELASTGALHPAPRADRQQAIAAVPIHRGRKRTAPPALPQV